MVVIEFKVIKIDFLNISPVPQTEERWRSMNFRKALALSEISDVNSVLKLKYVAFDKFNARRTIEDWVNDPNKKSPAQQLKEYWNSVEITELRNKFDVKAYLVVIIGCRKIVLWPLDINGQLGSPELVG